VLLTGKHEAMLTDMLQGHALGRHLCIVGDKGCGKSTVARVFASRLGYPLRLFSLYADMSARDLLQRRSTDVYVH
jgi:MoxR-like ATPase